MQEVSGVEQADLDTVDTLGAVEYTSDDRAGEPIAWQAARLPSARPHLRLVVNNPGLRQIRRPDAVVLKSSDGLAGRLANRWATAFSDDEPFVLHPATIPNQDLHRELAPITPLFPYRRA